MWGYEGMIRVALIRASHPFLHQPHTGHMGGGTGRDGSDYISLSEPQICGGKSAHKRDAIVCI